MTYDPINPPFTVSFGDMPKKELNRYLEWFCGVLPDRLGELTIYVKETHGYERWQPDGSPGSLDLLGRWFAEQVAVRPRSENEMKFLEEKMKFPMDVPREELTTLTLSLAMDVGMYLSRVFMKNNAQLKWEQPLGSKKFIDYGQPVLVSFKPGPFNPVRMVVTLAYGLVGDRNTAKGLRHIYETWSKLAV